jgi:hypothetical protein
LYTRRNLQCFLGFYTLRPDAVALTEVYSEYVFHLSKSAPVLQIQSQPQTA